MNSDDKLLMAWMLSHSIPVSALWLYIVYLVAHGHSPWWFVLAAVLSLTSWPDAVYKRFGIKQ